MNSPLSPSAAARFVANPTAVAYAFVGIALAALVWASANSAVEARLANSAPAEQTLQIDRRQYDGADTLRIGSPTAARQSAEGPGT